ncbi:hypothetical protein [Halorubellus salinus]|uniref:hypothetical protein n=1 Tax=Halorubellus salinus TaxID=755309 RepID=UPI001D08EF62|nr:hypothetical protein [Halorubellus salinus]
MNSHHHSHEPRNALDIPRRPAPSSLEVLGRAAALVVAVLAVLAVVVLAAANVPAVAVVLGMLAVAALVVGAVALPIAFVAAVGASI